MHHRQGLCSSYHPGAAVRSVRGRRRRVRRTRVGRVLFFCVHCFSFDCCHACIITIFSRSFLSMTVCKTCSQPSGHGASFHRLPHRLPHCEIAHNLLRTAQDCLHLRHTNGFTNSQSACRNQKDDHRSQNAHHHNRCPLLRKSLAQWWA